ncbi:DUF6978 family protein [Synergistes jonesii]|uniref:DUF6978 family protein n=1 Tax=Synergistes jonesii TaxID=2754 RepID=UPI00248D3CE6|nr:hypothetical protein [Synergistes jonesii]
MTDEDIQQMIELKKTLQKKDIQKILSPKQEYGHYRSDVKLLAASRHTFLLRTRRSIYDEFDFSVILSVHTKDGANFNLMRCNGPSHVHRNMIEDTKIIGPHRHIATQRYIEFGGDAEGFAESVDVYKSFNEALEYMMKAANISTQQIDGNNLSLFQEEGGDEDG